MLDNVPVGEVGTGQGAAKRATSQGKYLRGVLNEKSVGSGHCQLNIKSENLKVNHWPTITSRLLTPFFNS